MFARDRRFAVGDKIISRNAKYPNPVMYVVTEFPFNTDLSVLGIGRK